MRIVLTEAATPILGQKLEVLVDRIPSIFLRMVVGAMVLLTFLMLFARVYLVVARMVLLFLPAMTLRASVLVHTSVGVRSNKVIDLPVAAQLSVVVVDVWFSSQVLPVVGVDTVLFVVILAPRAPRSLEVKDVEVGIAWFHFVEQVDCDLVLAMGKCTQLSVLAVLHVVGVRLTKLAFVFLGMIEFLDPVVGSQTVIPKINAFVMKLAAHDVGTHF